MIQVLHTALVMAYLSELKADIVVELAELENVNLLKQILCSLVNYSTKVLPDTLKSCPLVSTDPTMLLQTGERLVYLDQCCSFGALYPMILNFYLDEGVRGSERSPAH